MLHSKKRDHQNVLGFSCRLKNRVCFETCVCTLSDENYDAVMMGKGAGAMCSWNTQVLHVKTNILIFNLEVTLDQHSFTRNFHWFNIRILFSFFKSRQLSMLFASYK